MNGTEKPYAVIGQNVLQTLKQGTIPWVKEWRHKGPPHNGRTGQPYTGINAVALDNTSHHDPRFVTYSEALDMGGHVYRGQKGYQIVGWREVGPGKHDQSSLPFGKQQRQRVPRLYTVFNIEQCAHLEHLPLPVGSPTRAYQRAEDFIQALDPRRFRDERSSYEPISDQIHIPARESFGERDHFYAEVFHELGHWTGHSSRLNRPTLTTKEGNGRAHEELVASLTSSFLCSEMGLNGSKAHQAAYRQQWINYLEQDPRNLNTAASEASKATQYLVNRARAVNPGLFPDIEAERAVFRRTALLASHFDQDKNQNWSILVSFKGPEQTLEKLKMALPEMTIHGNKASMYFQKERPMPHEGFDGLYEYGEEGVDMKVAFFSEKQKGFVQYRKGDLHNFRVEPITGNEQDIFRKNMKNATFEPLVLDEGLPKSAKAITKPQSLQR